MDALSCPCKYTISYHSPNWPLSCILFGISKSLCKTGQSQSDEDRKYIPGFNVPLHICREGIVGDQLKIDVADILSYNDDLAKYVEENPSESLPLVCH